MTRNLPSLVAPAVLAALAAVALIGAGCGSDTPSATEPSAATGTATASSTLSKQEMGVKFAECIRAHGVSDFPDPDPKGDYNYGVSVTAEVWNRATTACKRLQPPGTRSPKQQSAALRFAQCVRDNGVKDFPDPVNGEPLINTYEIPSSNKPGGMTILDAATQKCGSVLEEAAGGQK
jgi:hypothetical protein